MDHPDSTQFDLADDDGPYLDLPEDFEDNAVLYQQAKAEVARLAKALGITPGAEGRAPSVSRAPAAARPAQADGEDRYPSKFGRGWIPAERDIGLPGETAHSPRSREGDTAPAGDLGLHSYRFTRPRRALFLHYLSEQGSVEAACARVGISRQAAYLARRRDATFRAGWQAAMVVARPVSEAALGCRALDGVREPVYYKGELVGERIKFDSRLLLAHLARLDAAAAEPLAEARAERFDELLALVAGEDFAPEMADRFDGLGADPLLPMDRDRYALTRGGDLFEPEPEEPFDGAAEDRALRDANAAADAEWQDWAARVAAVEEALVRGEEPVVAAGEAAAGEGENFRWTPSTVSTCAENEACAAPGSGHDAAEESAPWPVSPSPLADPSPLKPGPRISVC